MLKLATGSGDPWWRHRHQRPAVGVAWGAGGVTLSMEQRMDGKTFASATLDALEPVSP